jgi:PAS domain S-box-containing protein
MDREGDKIYRQLYESIRDGIVSVAMDGRITGANRAYQEMLGYTLDELKELTYVQLTPEKWHAMEQDIVDTKLMVRGYSDEYEKEYIRKDGSIFPISLRTWVTTSSDGRPAGMWAIVRDITEQKSYEKGLSEARANWEKSFETISEAMFILDEDLHILQYNRAFAALVGKGSEDLTGRTCFSLVHDAEEPPDFCVTCECIRSRDRVGAELYEPFLGKYLDARADPYFDDDGSFEFALHTIRDITERKTAEGKLERQFATFRGVIDSFDYPIFSLDGTYRYTSFNRSHAATMKALYGNDIELGHSLAEYQTVEADWAKAKENIDSALEGRRVVEEAFSGCEGLDRMYFEVLHEPITGEDGDVIGVAISARNITERRKMEDALRESEERYREIFENAAEGIFRTTPGGALESANPALARMFGYASPERMVTEVTDITLQLYTDPSDREEVLRQIDEQGSLMGVELSFKRRDGSPLWISLNAHIVADDKGEVQYFEGTMTDITERRAAEADLRLALFEVDNAADMVLRVGVDGSVLFANAAACERYGAQREDLESLSVWDLDPTISPEAWRERWNARKLDVRATLEGSWQDRNGELYPVSMTLSYLEFEGQEYLVALARDVTKEKKAADELAGAEQRYRELAETLPQVVFEMDGYGKVTYVNQVGLEIFGYRSEDVSAGIHALDIIEQVDRERVSGAIDKMMDGRSSGAIREYLAKRRDGTVFPAMVFSTLITAEDGSPAGIRGILTDISERKEFEEALEASERKYRELANSLPEVVFEIDKDGVFTYVNESGAARFGYSADEIVGKVTPLEIMAPEERNRAVRFMRQVFAEGRVPPTEFTVFRKDGTAFPAMIYGSLSLHDGEPFGMSGLVMDISERKKYEEELQRANVELEGFAHTVSHDLRGPLTVISFASDLISQNIGHPATDEVEAALDEATRLLARNVTKASDLIEDLLALAEAGQAPTGVTDVDVAETVESVLDENAAALRRKNMRVRVGPDLGYVRANPTHMYQVFANLVANSLKHSNGVELSIVRLPTSNGHSHKFLVRDDGQGIKPDALKKIFLPFVKGPDGGTGIGLSTVQRVVELYGGRIRAYNDDGACFEFSLKDWQD